MTNRLKTYLALSLAAFSTVACTIVLPSVPVAQVKNDDQAYRAAMSEARTYVGSINRSQQAHYLEKEKFAESLGELETGIPSETKNYIYASKLLAPTRVQSFATPKVDNLTPYVGAVILTKVKDEGTVLATLCKSDQTTKTAPPEMIFKEGEAPICPEGYHKES
jgi:hypothetical protein